MPRPRRSHVVRLDADVLNAGAHLERAFYGLEVARILNRERSTVYKSPVGSSASDC